MRNILLKLKYLGTNYHGWQVQSNASTVQETLQDALEEILQKREDVKGCSRTDAGVHANMYCCTFKTESTIENYKLMGALNSKLPCDISVFSAEDVPDDFHPRYSCTAKQYVYKIHNSVSRDPFLYGRALQYKPYIDEKMLEREAQDFIGTHDFTTFCGAKTDVEDCTRTIYNISVKRDRELVIVSVSGDGFLYNMVRIIVGTLLFINEGKRPQGSIPSMIAGKDRGLAGQTAPACGLYLNKVFYGGEVLSGGKSETKTPEDIG